jgi:DNA-binding MarR family transcriptional regulator
MKGCGVNNCNSNNQQLYSRFRRDKLPCMASAVTRVLAEDGMAAWRAFLLSYDAVMIALEKEHAAAGLVPLAWFDVLVQLDRSGGRLRMNQLAEAIVLSRSGLTRLVDRMERDGLVTRQVCSSDRRGLEAVVTPTGRAALKRALPVHLAGIDRYFLCHLDAGERRRIAEGLAKVLAGSSAEAVSGRETRGRTKP